MKRWLITFALLAAAFPALAGWQSRDSNYNQNVVSGGGGGFTGPCEVSGVTCVAFYAVEACATNAYSGNTVDVVDTATFNTTGTRLQCASGVVSALVSGSACTFVTGNACSSLATTCATACTLKTVYNQLGTATFPDLTPSGGASSTTLQVSTSALNSKACISGNGSQGIVSASSPTLAQPFTIATVAKRTGAFTSQGLFISDNSAVSMSFRATVNTVGSFGGTVTTTATDSAFHSIMEVSASGAGNSFMVADGTSGSTGTLSGAWSGQLSVGSSNSVTNAITGLMCEILVTSNALNSTQYNALNTNVRASNRWGNSF